MEGSALLADLANNAAPVVEFRFDSEF